ncbi:membrane AbrB-like protein [Bacillus ectoiniformans]|uniref:AbrB family transcriptional regulator n=1 Tax=Bacillus ectoiniformans TaxID=1494429 RepID=UPI00195A6252|nr:AbrB family transcriptional regulator [Bacillus ectoiniformans]MBM7648923.1 membrane AbrB-like protein [Bacillus ectoiniformans]
MFTQSFMKTVAIALAAGYLFVQLHIILPWLLGPLIVIALINQGTEMKLSIPKFWRNTSLIIIGISLGTSFLKEAIQPLAEFLPYMFILTTLVVALTVIMAWYLTKWTSWDMSTALLGSLPGGLSQMVLMSEEDQRADASVVTLMQTLRVFFVVTIVPFAAAFLAKKTAAPLQEEASIPSFFSLPMLSIVILSVMFIVFTAGFRKIHMPIPFLLAPMAAVITWNMTGGDPFIVPALLLNAAQVLLGIYLGLKMVFSKESLPMKYLLLLVIMNVSLVVFCLVAAYLLHVFLDVPLVDLFISLAPGGVAEMAVTSMSAGADIAMVTSFHLFRIFYILFFVSPLTAWWMRRRSLVN